jgi:transcriptional regulator with XRE-family HTH domain
MSFEGPDKAFRLRLCSAIKDHLREHQITKIRFCERIGTSRDSLDRWLRGDGVPTRAGVKKMCEILGWNFDRLYNSDAAPVPSGSSGGETSVSFSGLSLRYAEEISRLDDSAFKTISHAATALYCWLNTGGIPSRIIFNETGNHIITFCLQGHSDFTVSVSGDSSGLGLMVMDLAGRRIFNGLLEFGDAGLELLAKTLRRAQSGCDVDKIPRAPNSRVRPRSGSIGTVAEENSRSNPGRG